jgi:hypothetical protein
LSHIFRRSASGLVLAENRTDEETVGRLLREIDDHLILVRDIDRQFQVDVWRVYLHISDWQDAVHICDWRDEITGEPLPLSSGILNAVQLQRKENRNARLDEDAANAALVAKRRQEFDADVDGIAHEHRKKVWRAPDPHDVGGQYSMFEPQRRWQR